MAYLGYKKDIAEEYNMNKVQLGRNFYACLWIFFLESILVWLIIKSVVIDRSKLVSVPSIEVFICRFFLSLLLHFEHTEDVKQGTNMMLYLNTNPEEFSSTFFPFVIALLQAFGGLLAEAISLLMLSIRTTVGDCITSFIAFKVLSSIDNIYAESLTDFALEEAVEKPLIYKNDYKKIAFTDRSLSHKIIRIVWKSLDLFCHTVYYYFIPLSINFIPYIFPCPG